MLVPSKGHKYGGHTVKEASVLCPLNFVVETKSYYSRADQHIEINTSSSATTVHLAKTKAITQLLTYGTAFSGRHLMSHNANENYGQNYFAEGKSASFSFV